jgi:hypothetical protein
VGILRPSRTVFVAVKVPNIADEAPAMKVGVTSGAATVSIAAVRPMATLPPANHVPPNAIPSIGSAHRCQNVGCAARLPMSSNFKSSSGGSGILSQT